MFTLNVTDGANTFLQACRLIFNHLNLDVNMNNRTLRRKMKLKLRHKLHPAFHPKLCHPSQLLKKKHKNIDPDVLPTLP